MFPSSSDRASLLPVLLGIVVVFLGAVLLLDFDSVVSWVNSWAIHGARFLALAFTFTLLIDAALILPLWALERGLIRMTGMLVEY